jgi:hypothetical protein
MKQLLINRNIQGKRERERERERERGGGREEAQIRFVNSDYLYSNSSLSTRL